jgi:hypothetical protein
MALELEAQLRRLIHLGAAAANDPRPEPEPQVSAEWSPAPWHRPGYRPRDVVRLFEGLRADERQRAA